MSATQLSLYNGAARLCEERKLASLSENTELRRYLDGVWDGGGVEYCLEMGLWSFAIRTVELTNDPSIEVTFGLPYAFNMPEDLVTINEISADENFSVPYNAFRIEGDTLYADTDTLYLSYVSKNTAYGLNMALWPKSFEAFVEAHFANKIVGRLTADTALRSEVAAQYKDAKNTALAKDAVKKPARNLQSGSWASARLGGGARSSNPQTRGY